MSAVQLKSMACHCSMLIHFSLAPCFFASIIKMRAVSSGTPYSADFFVVLDRLYDILSRTLVSWKTKNVSGMKKLLDRGGKKATAFWVERISVAHDLGCALKYLHSNQ